MGTLFENGIAVDFTSETSFRIFKLLTIDERVVRERFRGGVFANLYSRQNGAVTVRFVVLWDEGRGRPFLLKLRKTEGTRWEAVSINETCPGHEFAEGFVMKKHVEHAANAFYSSRRALKKASIHARQEASFPTLSPNIAA